MASSHFVYPQACSCFIGRLNQNGADRMNPGKKGTVSYFTVNCSLSPISKSGATWPGPFQALLREAGYSLTRRNLLSFSPHRSTTLTEPCLPDCQASFLTPSPVIL